VTAAANAIPATNYITFETDFGPKRINYWHGVDLTLNARCAAVSSCKWVRAPAA
jgi:hypothetical protein